MDHLADFRLLEGVQAGYRVTFVACRLRMIVFMLAMASVPTVKLNNGVEMPMISLGTWQYDPSTAERVVKLGLSLGFNHIDTANDYRNQRGVGAALPTNRSSYFLTTKVPSQTYNAYAATTKDLNDDIEQLGLDYVEYAPAAVNLT